MVHAPYPDISMMKVLGTIKMICDGLSRVVYGGLKGSETRDVKMAVSNFEVEHLEFIISHGFKPSMNQVEYHVRFQRPELLEYCKANGIELQAYRPLNQGASLEIEEIKQLASKYNTSTALIIYSWLEQLGVSVVGKATSDTHQHDLIIAQRVVLSEDDMMLISNLNRDERTCTKGGWCIPFTEEIKKRWLL